MEANIARINAARCYPLFNAGLSGSVSAIRLSSSVMPIEEANRAKLTAYVSCPFVVLILMVIAFFA